MILQLVKIYVASEKGLSSYHKTDYWTISQYENSSDTATLLHSWRFRLSVYHSRNQARDSLASSIASEIRVCNLPELQATAAAHEGYVYAWLQLPENLHAPNSVFKITEQPSIICYLDTAVERLDAVEVGSKLHQYEQMFDIIKGELV